MSYHTVLPVSVGLNHRQKRLFTAVSKTFDVILTVHRRQYVEIKCQLDATGFYCRSYCLLNMFRAPLFPSSGAQEYYAVVAACGISCCGFQVAGLVWS
jgi:hypothetical protein